MQSLNKGDYINDYQIVFKIKQSTYANTYRVKDRSGNLLFLKLICPSNLDKTQFSSNHNIKEIEILSLISHPNICRYVDSGSLILNGEKFYYLVCLFISGETVAERVTRNQTCTVYETKEIAISVLKALSYLHKLETPITHNEVTIHNIMYDMSTSPETYKLIDFGSASYLKDDYSSISINRINPFYWAPERFNGVSTIQSDLYSVGVLIYHLLFGIVPWYVDLSKYETKDLTDFILSERSKPLKIYDNEIFELDDQLLNTIHKAISYKKEDRFQSAEEFVSALLGNTKVEEKKHHNSEQVPFICKAKGNGFADIAGMIELKEQLQNDVIDLLENPEENAALGIPMPNGILFYGPPGCGKTFFAEKFAEEVGCNYMYVKCSDVASPYIHGGQGKIAAIFEKAKEQAPTILFFDEIESMITDRNKQTNVSESGEVNEFLAQLNNCGKSKILVIGASNNPTKIDSAALRAGRLEQKIYIPQPDDSTRKAMLELYLDKRSDFGIDYDYLVEKTKNFVSSDIKLLTDMAARLARKQRLSKICMQNLIDILNDFHPTVTIAEIKKHEAIRSMFEGKSSNTRNPIGFK